MKIRDVTLTLFTWQGLDAHADAAYGAALWEQPHSDAGLHVELLARRGCPSGRAIEKLGCTWFEDPLAEQGIYNHVRLRQAATQKFGVLEDIEIDQMACTHAPAGPGLGAEIARDRIAPVRSRCSRRWPREPEPGQRCI